MGILFEAVKRLGKSSVKSFSEGLKEGYEASVDDQVREAVARAAKFMNNKKMKDDKNSFSFRK